MTYLWLAIIFSLTISFFNIGKAISFYSHKISLLLIFLCWGALLGYIFIISKPQYESQILEVFPNYIYLRGGIYLPAITLFFGIACRSLAQRSKQALTALIIFLSVIAIYDYRWSFGIIKYSKINGVKNQYGICFNSIPETRAAAAATTLVYYYGVDVTEGWMAEATLTRSRSGTDMIGILNGINMAFEGTGCKARLKKIRYGELVDLQMPCLVFFKSRTNFLSRNYSFMPVVCLGINDRWMMLASPRRGLAWIHPESFYRDSTGYAIVVEKPFYIKPGLKKSAWL